MTQNYNMIDVGEKSITRRRALATGSIRLASETMEMVRRGHSPKGNILAMAEVAGIMAAKNTAQILPLCHPLPIDSVKIWFEILEDHIQCFCEVRCEGKTGVEMEALVGLNTALLTIYDLAKAVDPVIEIQNIFLHTKEGGKSGTWIHPRVTSSSSARDEVVHLPTGRQARPLLAGLKFSVGTLSDRASRGIYEDKSGQILRDYCLSQKGLEVVYRVIPDEKKALEELVTEAREKASDLLLLTGGTGISERDITPDVLKAMASKELPGFGELQRQSGAKHTPLSWLSRSSAYVVGNLLVILFPGSPNAVRQGVDCLGPLIPHAISMMRGQGHSGMK